MAPTRPRRQRPRPHLRLQAFITQNTPTPEASIKSLGDGAGHSVGSTLTFADIVIFANTVNTFCGFFDGLSVDMLKDWPAIQSVNKTVSNHPAVRKYYDEGNGAKLGGMWTEEIRAAFISARD